MEKFEEWTIENFSSWNREIHGTVITTSKSVSEPEFTIDLFPKGFCGKGEYLVTRLRCSQPATFIGQLAFIGSDGSTLCKQQMNSTELRNDITLPPGPIFEEVISEIKKKRDVHGDRLTVRYRIKRHRESNRYRRTIIDIFYITFRISPEIFDDLDSTHDEISWLIYPCGEEQVGRLKLYILKGQIDGTKIMLALQPDPFKSNVLIRTRMSVLNKEDDVTRTEENEHIFRDGEIWTFAKSLTLEEGAAKRESFILNFKIIPNNKNSKCVGVLHYHRNAVLLVSTEKLCPAGPRVPKINFSKRESNLSDDSVQNLSKELMHLLQDHDFSDLQLKCDHVSFPVHRNILSARSPVFKSMLSCEMKEAMSGVVDIPDMDPSTLAHFLAFLYTGTVEGLQGESALKLYYAADKYQVPALKIECSTFLCCNVSISNVCDILTLANKHQDDELTSVAQDFILNTYNEVLSSKEWASFFRNEPILAVETLTHFAKKNYVRKSDAF